MDNVSPRRDVAGQIIDAHGGCLQLFDGAYYLYGSAFGTNHVDSAWDCPFSVYTSQNLGDWTRRDNLLKDPPRGVYYRPYVVFNPKTKKYVLWFNWYQKLWTGQAGVAVSDNPGGPFVIVNQKAHLSGKSPGDGSLFVDNDGTGYYIYSDIADDYALRIEKLTADFTDSTSQGSDIVGYGVEAPLLFRRDDRYYVLAATLCNDCPEGSEVGVEISSAPLGPYAYAGEINHQSGTNKLQASEIPIFKTNDAANRKGHGSGFSSSTKETNPFLHAQQTWVAQLPTATKEPFYIWMADVWNSADDGLSGHDFQYWSSPLEFNPNGTIQPLKYAPRWSIVQSN